jgi:hypothetical protein
MKTRRREGDPLEIVGYLTQRCSQRKEQCIFQESASQAVSILYEQITQWLAISEEAWWHEQGDEIIHKEII